MGDLEEQAFLDKNDKPSYKRISEQIKMQHTQNFISKIYCSVIFLFLIGGGVLVASIFNESYKEIAMAHQLITVVGCGLYVLVLLLMVICNGHNEIRIIILLVICFSMGSLLSFLGALNLMNLTLSLSSQDYDYKPPH